jgi:hypothetical protein
MNIKKILKIFLFSILISGCGYSPMFMNFDNSDFGININNTSGTRKINNLILSNLKSYTKRETENKFNISFNSEYLKNIIAKDSTGSATEYKITIHATFTIQSLKYNGQMNFSESFNMQSMSNKLDENDYEENIQTNLTNTITRKLILRLSQLK